MRFISVFGLLLSVLIACPSAFCDDEAAAKEAFKTGVENFNNSRYEEAVRAFRNANELHPSWKIMYNIGQCEAALKRYGLAIEAFERYLANGGDDVPEARRDEVISEIKRFRELVGVVHIEGPDHLDVFVDGIHRGTTPVSSGFLVSAGTPHEFKIMDGDSEMLARVETLRGGLAITLNVNKESEGPGEANRAGEDGLKPTAFWIGVAATGVFGATALGLEFGIKKKIDDVHADPDNDSLRDSAKKMQTVNYVMIGLTGAALVTTVILAIMTDFGEKELGANDGDVALVPWTSGDGAGLALGGRF